MIQRLGVLAEETENNNPKWTLAAMEKYMRDQGEVTLGLVPRTSDNDRKRYSSSIGNDKSDNLLHSSQDGDLLESAEEESSPSWASSSTGNTPSYGSGGISFEFLPKTENVDKMKNSVTPVITTTNCTPISTPVKNGHPKTGRSKDSTLSQTLSSDLLSALDSDSELPSDVNGEMRKLRKGSADSVKDNNSGAESQMGTPTKGSKLSRLLRRTHSAGCSKDVPAHTLFTRDKTPVTKTKSADSAPCSREDGDEKQKRNRKTLAQDMKMRLSFLRRRHTDSSLQASVRPSPEEASKWAESFHELTNSKYGLSLFTAFLSREFSEENIEFWLACEDYKRSRANKLSSKARKIYDDFVAVQSPREVNFDSTTRSSILGELQNPNRHSFDSAQRRIQGMLEQDAYLRFLQSELYTELIEGNPNPSS